MFGPSTALTVHRTVIHYRLARLRYVLDRPKIELSQYGVIADEQIKKMNNFYNHISVDKYVVMPNHIHLLISLNFANGRSRTPVPTIINNANSEISKFVGTFKRFTNKKYGKNIRQRSFYDHIIRGEEDFREIWEYIDGNPQKWLNDRFYSKGENNDISS